MSIENTLLATLPFPYLRVPADLRDRFDGKEQEYDGRFMICVGDAKPPTDGFVFLRMIPIPKARHRRTKAEMAEARANETK